MHACVPGAIKGQVFSSLVAHNCRCLSQFLKHEATKSVATLLDGMLVHHRLPPSILSLVPIYLYSWVERGTVRVKCLAQKHNTVTPARA